MCRSLRISQAIIRIQKPHPAFVPQQTGDLGSKYSWQALTPLSSPLTDTGKIADSTKTCKTPLLSDLSWTTATWLKPGVWHIHAKALRRQKSAKQFWDGFFRGQKGSPLNTGSEVIAAFQQTFLLLQQGEQIFILSRNSCHFTQYHSCLFPFCLGRDHKISIILCITFSTYIPAKPIQGSYQLNLCQLWDLTITKSVGNFTVCWQRPHMTTRIFVLKGILPHTQ